MEATEKLYGDYQLTATNPGGHSSLPVPDNAIYHIADALTRLQAYTFPFELNPVTRAYFERMSTLESGQTAADMKGILREPTVGGGHRASVRDSLNTTPPCAPPAWPPVSPAAMPTTRCRKRRSANVNCRILPSHSREETRQQLIQIFNDPKVTVRYVNDTGEVMDTAPDIQRTASNRAAARSDAAFSQAGGTDVARCSRDSGHGNGRVGRQIYQRGWLADLWRQRDCDRHR